MRALVTRLLPDLRREKVLVTDWPTPGEPVGKQVKTQTLFSGITNGTERNDLVRGNYAHADEALPAGWGYQNVGRVIAVGPDVTTLQVGDLLYMSADHMEYVLMAEDGLLIKLPPEIDQQQAALFGMSGVAMRTCRNAELKMGERLLIVGAGFIGQMAAQIAAVMGARVTLCDVDANRLALARQIGATDAALNVSDDGWIEHIPDASFDAVIDLAGVPGMEDRLIWAARIKGRVIFIAGRTRVDYSFNQAQVREIIIKQNSHFDTGDLANLCRMVSRKLIKIEPLLRDVVPVEQAGAIYETLRDNPNQLSGTVFTW